MPAYVELRGYAPSPTPHPFALAKGETVRLRGESELGLSVIEEYDIAQTPEGYWQARVVAYFYAIEYEGAELLAYHWHPRGRSQVTSPHLPGTRFRGAPAPAATSSSRRPRDRRASLLPSRGCERFGGHRSRSRMGRSARCQRRPLSRSRSASGRPRSPDWHACGFVPCRCLGLDDQHARSQKRAVAPPASPGRRAPRPEPNWSTLVSTGTRGAARQWTALPAATRIVRAQAALRSDRLSSYEQWSLGLEDALAGEYLQGMATLQTGEMFGGLDNYASGRWRAERET